MWKPLLLLVVGSQALVEALSGDYDERRLAACAESASPVLNEVCAVGTECDPDVRVADFVELYNPGASAVDLECFVVAGLDGVPFVARGELAPGELRGFGEAELGFRILKAEDEISLYRITRAPEGGPELVPLESLAVDAAQAHSFRSPDGGGWVRLGRDEAERDHPGSFGKPNPAPGERQPAQHR